MSEATNLYDTYIDRRVAEGMFRQLLQTNESYRVLNIYGNIGTGKSRFKEHIKQKYLLKDADRYLFLELDFENRVLHTPINAVMYMAKELQHRYKYNFVTLWKAYAILWHKRYKNSPLMYATDLPYIDEIKKLFKIDKKGNPIVELVKGFFRDNIYKELEGLKSLSTKEIEKKLYLFFVADLQELIKQKKFKDAIILLDNYHLLNEREAVTKCQRDEWIRDLIARISKDAITMIFSRESLEWKKCNIIWKSQAKSYKMDNFSPQDATRYLQESGVKKDEIQKGIVNSSGSNPFWLSLSKYAYSSSIPLKTPVIKKDILDSFLTTQNKEIIALLKVLAHTRFFNTNFIKRAIDYFGIALSSYDIDTVISYNFIKTHNSRFVLDELFAKEIIATQNEDEIKEAKVFIFSYYENLLHSLDKEIIKTKPILIDEVLEEAWHYLTSINHDITDHIDWLNYYVDRFFMYAAWEPFISRYINIIPKIDPTRDENIKRLEILYNNLAGLYESIGEVDLAKEYYNKVVQLNRPSKLSA